MEIRLGRSDGGALVGLRLGCRVVDMNIYTYMDERNCPRHGKCDDSWCCMLL